MLPQETLPHPEQIFSSPPGIQKLFIPPGNMFFENLSLQQNGGGKETKGHTLNSCCHVAIHI